MTVCSFFLQGRCRYGEKCWNEHPRGGRGGDFRGNQQPSRGGFGNRVWINPSQRTGGEFIQPSSFSRGGNDDWSRGGGGGGGGGGTSRDVRSSDFSFSNQNRFSALSSHSHSDKGGQKAVDDNANYVDTIQKDMEIWQTSGQWPFSCYSALKGRISGFVELSPEELRLEYYNGRASDELHSAAGKPVEEQSSGDANHEQLHSDERDLGAEQPQFTNINTRVWVDRLRVRLLSIRVWIFSIIVWIWSRRPLVLAVMRSLSPRQVSALPLRLWPPFHSHLKPQKTKPALQRSALHPRSASRRLQEVWAPSLDPQRRPTVAAASVRAALAVRSAAVQTPGHSADSLFTPQSDLTAEELKEFSAKRFTLGQIPLKPPPADLLMV
ncbi:Nucleoporin NUP42 [Labeo rohita]|uniref:Nucleoporin NUP42 n=1 Tax=Labeo rohita TaxID=84645 RepID=A0ABQ8LRJ4_LABRO|nr:Nucleoporin NUP42 [Labeo rohita]